MEIMKIFHPILGTNIYQPKEQTDVQMILKELYDYQQLDEKCKSLTGLSLFQFLSGQNKIEILLDSEDKV